MLYWPKKSEKYYPAPISPSITTDYYACDSWLSRNESKERKIEKKYISDKLLHT